MTNNKIALFLDIDGTLYDSSIRDLRESSKQILDELSKSNNIDLYIATGRSKNTISHISKYFDKFKGFVYANGQIVEIDNLCIYENSIDYKLVNEFIDFCDELKYTLVLLTDKCLYYNMFQEPNKSNFEKNIGEKIYPLNGKRFKEGENVPQMWLFVDNETLKKLRIIFPNLNIINWGRFGSDIINYGASKGKGVKYVIDYMGYDILNTYAIGDSDNDTVMFENVHTSICMGNGTTEAKKHADIIGYDIKEDGLAKNIYQYVLKTKTYK